MSTLNHRQPRRAGRPAHGPAHAAPRRAAVARAAPRPGVDAAPRLRRDHRPGRGAVRSPADHRPGCARRGRPRRRERQPAARAGGLRGRRHRGRGVRGERPAVPRRRGRPGDAADRRLPARARPVRAHPEQRASRLAGLAGHQRRRHDLELRAVRRPDADPVDAAARRRDRADAGLLAAAHRGRVGLLPAGVLPRQADAAPGLARLRAGPRAGRRRAVGGLGVGGRRRHHPGVRRGATHRGAGGRRRAGSTGTQRSARRSGWRPASRSACWSAGWSAWSSSWSAPGGGSTGT